MRQQKKKSRMLRSNLGHSGSRSKGSGVISVNGKMVDKPIVERAERVIALALAAKLITEEEI